MSGQHTNALPRQTPRSTTLWGVCAALLLAALLCACGGGSGSTSTASGNSTSSNSGSASATTSSTSASATSTSTTATGVVATTTLSLAAQVGKQLFFDTHISASGQLACASCHDPNHAYGPPNNLAVQLGGPSLTSAGVRAVPSLRYKAFTPPYSDVASNPDGQSAPGPGGGFTWDGRVDTLAAQAAMPLLSSFEMANTSTLAVVQAVQAASYAPLFMQAFGSSVFASPTVAFNQITNALQAFQLEDPSFQPYSSKFDLNINNKIGGTLTAAEQRGFLVYNSPTQGNCASCHYEGPGSNGGGSVAEFTDFQYEAIGVPRNTLIPSNSVSTYFDMGICGPFRLDHVPSSSGAPDSFCGMFKTPTLRNVSSRQVFFHNGVITSLLQALQFYNTRDTMPQIWYPTVGGIAKVVNDPGFPTYGLITTQYIGGTVQKFNDLPLAYLGNIDPQVPLDGRAAGSTPAMTDQNIADLMCFLYTLNDADVTPAIPPAAGSCVN